MERNELIEQFKKTFKTCLVRPTIFNWNLFTLLHRVRCSSDGNPLPPSRVFPTGRSSPAERLPRTLPLVEY